jgi:hypothetical protein
MFLHFKAIKRAPLKRLGDFAHKTAFLPLKCCPLRILNHSQHKSCYINICYLDFFKLLSLPSSKLSNFELCRMKLKFYGQLSKAKADVNKEHHK